MLGRGILSGIEVGVWKGELSAELLRTFPDLILCMVDPWMGAVPGLATPQETHEAYLEALQKTAFAVGRRFVIRRTSIEAAKTVENLSMDFVFIDALHDYYNVSQDLEAWYPKVRFGGLLAGHDYGGCLDRRGDGGVKRAVDEFCVCNGYVPETSRITWWIWKRERFDGGVIQP